MHKLTLKDIAGMSIYTQAVEQAVSKQEQAKQEQRTAMAQAIKEFGMLTREQAAKKLAKRNPGVLTPVLGDRVKAPMGDNINDPAKLHSKRRVYKMKPTWEEEANKRQAQYDEQQRQDYLRWLNKKAHDSNKLDSEFWATLAELHTTTEMMGPEPECTALCHQYIWGGVQGGAYGCISADIDNTKAKPLVFGIKADGPDSITDALKDLGVSLPKNVHTKVAYEDMGLTPWVGQALRNSK